MAIDNTGISLDAGASDITYTGDEGPKSPQQMQQQMQMASLVQEYKEYVRQQQDVAPHQILSFEDWYRMVYEASRAGQAHGGRINAAQGYPNPEKEFISETQLEENYPGLARGEVGRGFGSPQDLTTLEMQADAMVQAGVAATKEEAMEMLLQQRTGGLAYGGTAHPTYTQKRKQNLAYGGIAGVDGRKKYGIGSWFQEAKDKFVDDIIPNEIKENPMLSAAVAGGLLNQFGIPGTGGLTDSGDPFGQDWLGDY